MENISFNITGNNSQLLLKIEEIRTSFVELDKTTEQVEGSIKKVFKAIGGTDALKKFVSDVVHVRAEVQQFEVALARLLQSKEKANDLMKQVVRTAAETPFSITELASAAQQLVSYGMQADEVNATLMRLGEIASGAGISLEQITSLVGTVMTQGNLSLGNLEQFASSGVPMLQGLADMFGVTTEKVNEMVAAGQIGFPEVQSVMEQLTNEGGLFYESMETQSDTIAGKIENLGDAWNGMLNAVGQSQEGVIEGAVDGVAYLIEHYETVGKVLLSLIEIYGIYRAACIAHIVLTQSLMTTQLALGLVLAKLKAAFLAFTATMNLNPWVLAATALIGLGMAMWNFRDSTTAAEKAQKRFNDEMDRFKKNEEERKQKIENSLRIIQDETETEFAKTKAYKDLQRLTPALTAAYNREELATLSLAESQKVLNEERDKVEYDTIVKGISDSIKKIDELKTTISNLTVEEIEAGMGGLYRKEIANLEEYIIKLRGKKEEIDRIREQAKEDAKPLEVKISEAKADLQQIQAEFDKAKQKLDEEQAKLPGKLYSLIPFHIQMEFDIADKNLKEQKKKINNLQEQKNNSTTYQQDLAAARKEWLQAKRGYQVLLKDKTATSDQVQNAKLNLTLKENKYKSLGGSTENNTDNQAERLREQNQQLKELEVKNAKDIVRQLEDLYYDVEQAKVNGLAEGSEKTLAQMELNHEKELMAIDREKDEFLQRKKEKAKTEFDLKENIKVTKDPNYVKQFFDDSGIVLSDTEVQMFDTKYKAALDKQESDRQAYYKAEKQAMNEYLKEYGTYQEKRLAIAELYDDKISKATTDGAKKSLQEDKTKALSALDVEANKKANGFYKLLNGIKDRTAKDMLITAAEAQAALDYVNAGEFKTDSEGNGLFGISKEIFDMLRKSPEQLEKVGQGIKDVKAEATTFDNAFSKIGNGFQKIFKEGADPEKLEEGLAAIKVGMDELMQVGQIFANTLSSLGDAFGNETFGKIAEGVNVAMDSVNATMNGAMTGGAVFGLWGAAAGAAIGLATSLASSIAKIHDAKNEKRIKRLQEQIDTLNRSYGKLGDSVEKAYSSDASQLIEQQNQLLEQQKVLIQNQIKEEESKKKSDKGRIKEWQNQIEDIDKTLAENKEKQIDVIFGQDVKSAIEDFAQAYADVWAAGDDRAKSSKDFVKKMIKQMILESIKAASSQPMEALRQRLADFFSDGIISAWEQQQIEDEATRLMNNLDRKFTWADRFMKEEKEEPEREVSQQGLAQASQESVDKLDGVMTNIQGHTYSLNENVRAILDTMKGDASTGMLPAMGKTTESGLHTVSLADIDRNMNSMIGLSNVAVSHLSSIADHTSRLATIEQTMSSIKLGIDTLNTKGVIIKR